MDIAIEENTQTILTSEYNVGAEKIQELFEDFKAHFKEDENASIKILPYAHKVILNKQRDKELKLFIIDNIEMNEDIIYKMSVKYNTTTGTDKIKWINADNNIVEFTKQDFGALIKKGTDKIEEIYFKYRQLKDKALQEAN